MSSAIYFLSHAHWLYLQHLSQLSALLRLFCFRNKILQLHFVAQNRRRQRSAQHVPHRALASFAPAASTCKIKQNAAALCNTNMIATHCTNTSHSNRRTPYVRARRPKIPASNNSGQSARGSTAQCYLQLVDLNASAAVLVQPLASTREDIAWTEAAAQTRRMRARRTSKNELSSFGCNQMPHCRSPRLISILQHEHKRTQAAWQQQRAIVPVQTSAAVFIQSTEALFSTWKLVL